MAHPPALRGCRCGFVPTLLPGADPGAVAVLSAPQLARLARLALACVHREYPNRLGHVLQSDADVAPPRKLTPVFYGCFDWHSAVHGHWLLVRLAKSFPQADFVAQARAALARSFTEPGVRGELEYLTGSGREAFERPYGLAWLLQLSAELRAWDDPEGRSWQRALEPLEQLVAQRMCSWLPRLSHPVRCGTHGQTAFALALALDWARVAGRADTAALLTDEALRFYADDRCGPLSYEPSGEDFLSPCLMEADLMRRVLPPDRYPGWLTRFLPGIPDDGDSGWLAPGTVVDRSDGKLVHLDGLNLARAWNLHAIAHGLPANDARRTALAGAAETHASAGLAGVTGEHYAGGHWLASFAVYLLTDKALEAEPPDG